MSDPVTSALDAGIDAGDKALDALAKAKLGPAALWIAGDNPEITTASPGWASGRTYAANDIIVDTNGNYWYASSVTGTGVSSGMVWPAVTAAGIDSTTQDDPSVAAGLTWTLLAVAPYEGVRDGDLRVVAGVGVFQFYSSGVRSANPALPGAHTVGLGTSSCLQVVAATYPGHGNAQWALVDYAEYGAPYGKPALDTHGMLYLPQLQTAPINYPGAGVFFAIGERVIAIDSSGQSLGSVWMCEASVGLAGGSPSWTASNVAGDTVTDGDITWVCLGAGPWQPLTKYADGAIIAVNSKQTSPPHSISQCWKVTSGGGGFSAATTPTWNTASSPITDRDLHWTYQSGLTSTIIEAAPIDVGVPTTKGGLIQNALARPVPVDLTGSLGMGWDAGALSPSVAYFKDAAGVVHLRGLLKYSTGADGTALQLPEGYRPSQPETFACADYNAVSSPLVARFVISSLGELTFLDTLTDGHSYSLTGIAFLAEK